MLKRSLLREAAFWAAWLALACALAALSYAASHEYYLPGDRAITFGIQDLHTQPWADNFFERANHLGDEWVLGSILGAIALLLWARRHVLEVGIVVACGASQFALLAMKAAVERPSDEYDAMRAVFDGLQHPRIYPNPGGFPSGHVFGEVVVFGLIIWLAARLLPWFPAAWLIRFTAIAAIIVGFIAPMYLGAHWFTDCVGGAMLAALVLMLAWRSEQALRREKQLVTISELVGGRRVLVRS
jgi:undecaprenyl-diphosphatase